MHKYLPSKKFLITLASIILAILIVVIINWLANKNLEIKNSEQQILSASSSAKINQFMILDTDGDTLKDWEEALYKTDPKLADTDNDGTNDGDELANNRDPLVKNTALAGKTPTDQKSLEVIADEKKAEEEFNQLTATEKMGRILFSQYLSTKISGQELSQNGISSIIQNTMMAVPAPSTIQYSMADLIVIPSNDNGAIKNYTNNVARVILTDFIDQNLIKQGGDIFGMAQIENLLNQINQNNTDIIKTKEISQALLDLNPIISKYQLTIKDLLKVPVPTGLKEKHLALINAGEAVFSNLSQIAKSEGDILAILPVLTSYQDSITNLINALSTASTIFTNNQVNFAPTDFASQLLNVIMQK